MKEQITQAKESITIDKIINVRSFTRTELAIMYMPYLSRSAALKNFNGWMKQNKKLQADLIQAGAQENTRRYTPKQVKIIFEAFDIP